MHSILHAYKVGCEFQLFTLQSPSGMRNTKSLSRNHTVYFQNVNEYLRTNLKSNLVHRACGAWAPTSFSRGKPASLVVASACVRARSLVRSCRRGARDRWAER